MDARVRGHDGVGAMDARVRGHDEGGDASPTRA